ncbi:uncharacterized protein BYT42DRAFT_563144 [Radiomyces spectabilis]|uniref:uncharacterized protein n=1 Tax=Radiomyces spectabilis TaxID=64574 RepID=UPI00221EE89C|nr:uncharacterized protein BYT42DRAFT_563144 [Radiomyces spectabilis]KAI8384632.1 hypothetical protein BYT42DRAFT_563144 [Radiomyces spectabilis]
MVIMGCVVRCAARKKKVYFLACIFSTMTGLQLDTLSYALLTTIFGAATVLSIRNAKGADIHPLLLNTQSDVSKLRHPGESAIYRSRMYPNGSPLLSTFDRNFRTVADLYRQALSKHASSDMVGERTTFGYRWHTYETMARRAEVIYANLVNLGLKPRTGEANSFVGLYATNSPNTVAFSLACHLNGLVTVPIAAKANSSHISHVLRDTSLTVLVVDAANLDRVLSLVEGTSVKHIIVIGKSVSPAKDGINIVRLQEFENTETKVAEQDAPVADDLASIYYSSTSIEQKAGVVLTHKNLLSSIASYLLVIPPQQKVTPKDRLMHNLPIDNVFGYVQSVVFIFMGASIVFADEVEGDHVDADISSTLIAVAEAKPTVYASGSAFLQQVKSLIESRYGNSFLFRRGLDTKMSYFEEGRLVTDSKYDMLVFRDIRTKLFGGQLRLMFVDKHDATTEPIAPFLRAVLGVQVLQCFNRPETSSTMTAAMFYDYKADVSAFGAPLPCNELKLMDLPEHALTSEDQPNPRGEIWVRGNNVFRGYWKNPQATESVIDADGWFNTRTHGELLPNGVLKLLS